MNKENQWYPDLGTSNHVTSDLSNLTMGTHYTGDNKVRVGNGASLDVLHIGSSSVKSSSNPNIVFHLKNLLHVPLITKNLISVSQFTKDNQVFFEFHPSCCFVKDISTSQILLQGKVIDGLDQFSLEKADSQDSNGGYSSLVFKPQVLHTSLTSHSSNVSKISSLCNIY